MKEKSPVLFFRGNGAVCYQIVLWEKGDEASAGSFIDTLFSSGRDWFWTSERRWGATEVFKMWDLPKKRQLTQLTSKTSETLFRDCLEQDEGDDGRAITIFGGMRDATDWSVNEKLQGAISTFAATGNPPLEILIYQPGDMAWDYVFVSGNPTLDVQAILGKWGIKQQEKFRKRKYKDLGLLTLERMFRTLKGDRLS